MRLFLFDKTFWTTSPFYYHSAIIKSLSNKRARKSVMTFGLFCAKFIKKNSYSTFPKFNRIVFVTQSGISCG